MSDLFEFHASGNTYPHLDTFKAHRWSWDPGLKQWEFCLKDIDADSPQIRAIRDLLGVEVEEINRTTGVSKTLTSSGSASSVQARFEDEVSQDRENW